MDPRVATAAGNKLVLAAVQRDTCQVILGRHTPDKRRRLPSIEEIGRLPRSHAEDAATLATLGTDVFQLAASKGAIHCMLPNCRLRPQIPPPDLLVL